MSLFATAVGDLGRYSHVNFETSGVDKIFREIGTSINKKRKKNQLYRTVIYYNLLNIR